MSENIFQKQYKRLNKEQKQAVDTIEGPVMVVAGPGTGKTQVLALRIGNILKQTQAGAEGVLCLTFTNSAVSAMRERLYNYIGPESLKVNVHTFHSFGLEVLREHYAVLGLIEPPLLMEEDEMVSICDGILLNNQWNYIRPKSHSTRYFRQLKDFISILKKERVSAEDLLIEIDKEINILESDPLSISSRGSTKGQIKKTVLSKIESLKRTKEAVHFFDLYEEEKKDRNLYDFDDILESLVSIVEGSTEVRDILRQNFEYVLIDEHQDSSLIQNEFLKAVWGEIEKPNIFVVGDDRQLIYEFSGASLEYFEDFKTNFKGAKLITLLQNYRSVQKILDSSHTLLESSLVEGGLQSNKDDDYSLSLVEADYERDEIIFAGLKIREKIKEDTPLEEMAVLVQKNKQVRSAMDVLRGMGIPVASGGALSLFETKEASSLVKVLRAIASPVNGTDFAETFFDPISGIDPISAHRFLKSNKMRDFSLAEAKEEASTLFDSGGGVNSWIQTLRGFLEDSYRLSLYSFIQKVGFSLLIDKVEKHEELMLNIEVVRTMLHLALVQTERGNTSLSEFIEFIDRLLDYGQRIPLAVFSKERGVRVMTMHGSKGLEFDFVWIAHMDTRSFEGGGSRSFTLPEFLKNKMQKTDELANKRKLYVALTRAKRYCTISYATNSYAGAKQVLSPLVYEIAGYFDKVEKEKVEDEILSSDPLLYVRAIEGKTKEKLGDLEELKSLVKEEYVKKRVSVSMLNNFFECPWKWYFKNLLQLPSPKFESTEFGTIIHNALESIIKLKYIPKENKIEEFINEEVSKIDFSDPGIIKKFKKEALVILNRWVKNRLSDIQSKRNTEQSISIRDEEFPHLNIYGRIDLVEEIDKEVIRVTDFKTGKPKKKSFIEKETEDVDISGVKVSRMSNYMRQLAMYSYLINSSAKWQASVRESRLEFVEADKEEDLFYSAVIGSSHVGKLVDDIRDYDEMIKNGDWVDRPCNFNSYGRKDAVCEFCKMAKIYTNKN